MTIHEDSSIVGYLWHPRPFHAGVDCAPPPISRCSQWLFHVSGLSAMWASRILVSSTSAANMADSKNNPGVQERKFMFGGAESGEERCWGNTSGSSRTLPPADMIPGLRLGPRSAPSRSSPTTTPPPTGTMLQHTHANLLG